MQGVSGEEASCDSGPGEGSGETPAARGWPHPHPAAQEPCL